MYGKLNGHLGKNRKKKSSMRKIFFSLLVLAALLKVQAQGIAPIGVYEGKDKILGMTRLGYLEINMDEPLVPDFSQQFVKGQNHIQ